MTMPTWLAGALLVRLPLLVGIVVMACPERVTGETPAIDVQKARQYFAEAKGALWKVGLCGPLLFVNPETRYAVRIRRTRNAS